MADPIIVVPYDPSWPAAFAQLGQRLRHALGAVALRIDHIGSTSVPGLDAKPVIDVQISVASFDPVDSYRLPLETAGYEWRAGNPELTKRYFREIAGTRIAQIHVRLAGSWGEQFALLFRDYMRTHPEDARAYAELKHGLAQKYREDRTLYTDAKDPFIWATMYKANAWSQEIGWRPGSSDA